MKEAAASDRITSDFAFCKKLIFFSCLLTFDAGGTTVVFVMLVLRSSSENVRVGKAKVPAGTRGREGIVP